MMSMHNDGSIEQTSCTAQESFTLDALSRIGRPYRKPRRHSTVGETLGAICLLQVLSIYLSIKAQRQ